MRAVFLALISILAPSMFLCAGDSPLNTWVEAKPEFKLPEILSGARWATGDGYSDNVYRSKTGTILIRTGIHCESAGYSPGFYTNTTLEWDLEANKGAVLDIANWGGGSSGGGKLLPAYKEHPTPTPRHTYDGICYVEPEDAMYLMLGANWRTGSNATEEAKAELARDGQCTWKYAFAEKRWTRIESSVWRLFKCSPYESHMIHWPAGERLIFLDDSGSQYAEFPLRTQAWEKAALKNKCPMRLYNARSDWDSKRQRWIFRLGPKLCAFDPKTKEFSSLPAPYEPPADPKDPRNSMKGIVYISKHDVYLINGMEAGDTWVFSPDKGQWTALKASGPKLINGYLQYDPKSDQVVLSYQLTAFRFRYQPEAEPLAGGSKP